MSHVAQDPSKTKDPNCCENLLPLPPLPPDLGTPVRPHHYAVETEHETYKCLRAWGLEHDAFLWTVGKYLSRALFKGKLLEDLRKAKWYLEKRIEQLEQKDGE